MTAYLKAHWPVEFMAALLTSDISGRNFKKKDSLVEHLEDCQRMNVTVEPPNVNTSMEEFSVADGKIRFGLSAIKGCGGAAAGSIVAERDGQRAVQEHLRFLRTARSQHGQPHGHRIAHQGRRVRLPTGGRRSAVFAAIDRALQSGASAASDRKSGQRGLFDDAEEPAEAEAAPAPRSARVGGEGQARQGKRGAGLLSLEPSAGRAHQHAQGVLLAHDRRGGRCWTIAAK